VPATVAAQPTAQNTYGAVPGSLQFVQGQANVDGQPISSSTLSSNPQATRQLRAGETLATANGSADVLLAPGALLRVGHNTTVQMVAADPSRTEVRVEQGLANVSVNLVRSGDLLLVDLPGGQTQLLSNGLYALNAETGTVRVFNGEAFVFPGADTTANVKPVTVKEGHAVTLSGVPNGKRPKAESFDRLAADADLLPWTGPQETHAALADSSLPRGAGYSYAGYGPAYGFYGDAYGYGYPYYAYGYPWGPYGFWGYPFFGVGFGFWGGGFYGGYPVRPIGPLRGGYAGGYGRAAVGGYAGHAFAGGGGFGGFHGGGFGGGRR
jgi:hypothetical protein